MRLKRLNKQGLNTWFASVPFNAQATSFTVSPVMAGRLPTSIASSREPARECPRSGVGRLSRDPARHPARRCTRKSPSDPGRSRFPTNGPWCCPDRELCEGFSWFECNSRTVHGVERTILVRCWRNGYRSRLRRLRPETLPGIGHRASCLGSRPCSDHHCRRAPESQWSCPRCRLLRHGRHRHGRGNDVVALRRTVLYAICVVRRSACRVLHRRSESDHVAIWVDVRALMLAPVSVFWQADLRPCGLPRPREFIGILDKEICRGARIGSVHKSKMNLDTVQGGIAVPATFVLPCREAKSLVMRKRGVEVTDWKDRRYSLRGAHGYK